MAGELVPAQAKEMQRGASGSFHFEKSLKVSIVPLKPVQLKRCRDSGGSWTYKSVAKLPAKDVKAATCGKAELPGKYYEKHGGSLNHLLS